MKAIFLSPPHLRAELLFVVAKEALIPLRDLLPLRCARGRRRMNDARSLVTIAFPRLPLGKWEKVPKGDEGSLVAASDGIAAKDRGQP